MILEVVPTPDSIKAPEGTAVDNQMVQLQVQAALAVLDLDHKVKLSDTDVRDVLLALDIEADADRVQEIARMVFAEAEASGNKAAIFKALRDAHVIRMQQGRHYVALTLSEAEAVRVMLQWRASDATYLPELSGCQASLRFIRRDPTDLCTVDASGWTAAPFSWHEVAAAQCFRFLGAETTCNGKDLEVLRHALRLCLAKNTKPMMPKFMQDFVVVSSELRRRDQPPQVEGTSLAQLFISSEQHEQALHDAVLRETYARLAEAGMSVARVFHSLITNKDRDADELTLKDFAVAEKLGFGLPPKLILKLFKAVDRTNRGAINQREWLAAFETDAPSVAATCVDQETLTDVPLSPPTNVTWSELSQVKVSLKGHTQYEKIWSSDGTLSKHEIASIWAAVQLEGGFWRLSSLRLSVGHYINTGTGDARGGGSNGTGERKIVELSNTSLGSVAGNTSEVILQTVADHYFPCPSSFAQAWCQQQRGAPLYIWRPVPPSDAFVALGMVVTTKPDPPPVGSVRCVLKSFCVASDTTPRRMWDNERCGGHPASMWIVNPMQVLWVSPGHERPTETAWKLASDTIQFSSKRGEPSVHMIHPKTPRSRLSTSTG